MVLASTYGFSSSATPAANKTALQNAINAAYDVELPDDANEVSFEGPITLRPGTRLRGTSATASRIRCTTDLAFVYHAPNGLTLYEAPELDNFGLVCAASGIQLNDPDASFVETGENLGQSYIMRPRFRRLSLLGTSVSIEGSFGINLNKCFSAVIDQCTIERFERGYWGRGSDFETITNRTRILDCGTLIHTEKVDSFGSGMLIDGADLLVPTRTFIKSSNRHLMVRDSYLEKQNGARLAGPVLDIEHNYITSFERNRFEVPYTDGTAQGTTLICPDFLKVQGEGALFEFIGNTSLSFAWGAVDWNGGDGSLYLHDTYVRQKIAVRDNRQALPVPFVTEDSPPLRNEYRDLWVLSPSTSGLITANYATSCRVLDGAFVLPALPSFGSLLHFRDADRPASGTVVIRVLAKASVAGQLLYVQPQNFGGSGPATSFALTTGYQWYTLNPSGSFTDLAIYLWNDDTTHGGTAHVKQIVVERA